eukprot:4379719-Prymnesium_polylepis.1
MGVSRTQKLGRLSRHSNHHLLTWFFSGLARIRSREVMSEVDRKLMGLVVSGLSRTGSAVM